MRKKGREGGEERKGNAQEKRPQQRTRRPKVRVGKVHIDGGGSRA